MPPLQGTAIGVSVTDAMRQILPLGWKLFTNDPIDPKLRLNWAGNGRNWVLVMNSVLVNANLNAFIDWSAREVTLLNPSGSEELNPVSTEPVHIASTVSPEKTFSPGEKLLSASEIEDLLKPVRDNINSQKSVAAYQKPTTVTPKLEVSTSKIETSSNIAVEAKRREKSSADLAVVEKITENAVAEAAPAEKVWHLNEDLSIRENFEIMAKSVGWRLVWSARRGGHVYDYPATYLSSIEFKGELMGSKGVMARITAAFINSSPALAIKFYEQNKVAEVTVYSVAEQPEASNLAATDPQTPKADSQADSK